MSDHGGLEIMKGYSVEFLYISVPRVFIRNIGMSSDIQDISEEWQSWKEFQGAGTHQTSLQMLALESLDDNSGDFAIPLKVHVPGKYWEQFCNAGLSDHIIHIVHQNLSLISSNAMTLDPSTATEALVAACYTKSQEIFKNSIGKSQSKKSMLLRMFKSDLVKFTYHLEPTDPSYYALEYNPEECKYYQICKETLVLNVIPINVSNDELPLASTDTSLKQYFGKC